jgi:hypothetical protein
MKWFIEPGHSAAEFRARHIVVSRHVDIILDVEAIRE